MELTEAIFMITAGMIVLIMFGPIILPLIFLWLFVCLVAQLFGYELLKACIEWTNNAKFKGWNNYWSNS